MLLFFQALETYKHSWKISRAPSEPRDPTSCVQGRAVIVQSPGKGMDGSQVALLRGSYTLREGTEDQEGAGRGNTCPETAGRGSACTSVHAPSPDMQPGTRQRGWVDCLGWQRLCLHRWSAWGRQMWRLPTPSCGSIPAPQIQKLLDFSLG